MIDAKLLLDGTIDAEGRGIVSGSALTVSRQSLNTLDMLSQRDVGVGDDLELHVQVGLAFVGVGASLQIVFMSSPDNVTFYEELLSPVYPVALLVAGRRLFRYKWPIWQPNDPGPKPGRYFRLAYSVQGGPFTAGTVIAYVTGGGDRQVFIPYGPNYNVAP